LPLLVEKVSGAQTPQSRSRKTSCVLQEFLYVTVMAQESLVAWIGNTDLKASRGELSVGLGPIAQAAKSRGFREIHLLSDHSPAESKAFANWLKRESGADPTVVSPVV